MGTLIEGNWRKDSVNSSIKDGEFKRQVSSFRDFVSSKEGAKFIAEKDRYHLYVSYACPWAHRTLIYRALKGLENTISVSIVSPKMGEDGWSFVDDYNGVIPDKVNSSQFVKDLYIKADAHYTGKATVPVLWDKKLGTMVSNESSDIIKMLNSEFDEFAENPGINLRPNELETEIEELNKYIYDKVNNGVYKSGFATTQKAYENNVKDLFLALDELDARLENQQYLFGESITETDIRLFTTLVRFDIVYYSHFKCNLKMIKDYKNLHRYLLEIYEIPKLKPTVNFDHIKTHYYWSQDSTNPTRVVPIGPQIEI